MSSIYTSNCPFVFQPELSVIVNKLKPSAPGHDELSELKLTEKVPSVHCISKPLIHLLNLSLLTGVVPDQFKWAKVIPLSKADNPSLVSNYRPISILSKLMEKVVYKLLMTFLKDYNLLCSHQYGFKEKTFHLFSTNSTYKISTALDNNTTTIGVFVDLSKTFDTVNHDILLQKLSFFGNNGTALQWFQSYV